jgi:uncharacterized protein YqfB (UPF0267 family)
MRAGKYLMILAAVCLLAAPALSAPYSGGKGDRTGMMNCGPMDRGMERSNMVGGHWGWFPLGDDLTEEEMETMTLAELREIREERMNQLRNMTAEEMAELKEQKRAEMENMTLGELRDSRRERSDRDRPFIGCGPCLLVTDLTVEDLEGMTLAEIEALKEEKVAEMENMTLAEINELCELRKAEMENMTLAELREEMEVCKTLGLGGVGKDRMMGPRGFEDGQFRKSADWGEKQGRGEWRDKKMAESQL